MTLDSELGNMGHAANLIAHLLDMGGPMTIEQMKRWVAEDKTVDVTLAEILQQMQEKGIVTLGEADLWRLAKPTMPERLVRLDSLGSSKVVFVSADYHSQAVLPREDWEAWGRPMSLLIGGTQKP